MKGDGPIAERASYRASAGLQQQFADVLRQTGDLAGAELLLRDLIARHGPKAEFRTSLAAVLHEIGRLEEAEVEARAALGDELRAPAIKQILVAVLLSLGRADEAMAIVRAEQSTAPLDEAWIAWEAIAARLLNDSAYSALYDYDRLVRVYDLTPPQGWSSMAELNAALEATLSARHRLARPPFDQTLRAGTQTIGNLVEDSDPAIRAVLQAFEAPIADYRTKLGDAAEHPLSRRNRGEARIETCWSVRLRENGFHVNHVHRGGWLSSAYYIAVPSESDVAETRSGWIKFGEPPHPVPGIAAAMTVRPQPGRLVLFPSYMWHGTYPVHGTQPRLAMAFDVVTRAPTA